MFKFSKQFNYSLLFLLCIVLLAACSGGQSNATKSNAQTKEEPVEVTEEPVEDIEEPQEEEPIEEEVEAESDKTDDSTATTEPAKDAEEIVTTESESTTAEASESNEAAEEVAEVEVTDADSAENVTESTEPEDAGTIQSEPGYENWVDGKGLPWKDYFGSDFDVDIDPATKFANINIQSVSSPFKYAPLKGEGVCWAEYCMSADELPETAFFAADGYIYDMEYAGTWEYHFELNDPWMFYAWNFE
ncbi:hypothetical protein ACI2JA_01615 [Alkalihalobacillus sp. NPDC078783]